MLAGVKLEAVMRSYVNNILQTISMIAIETVLYLKSLLESRRMLPLFTFLLFISTLLLAIFSYCNSRLLKIINAESEHFPKIREASVCLINRLDKIKTIVLDELPFLNSPSLNLWNFLRDTNTEKNLLISDMIQFHIPNRKKEICERLKNLDILFEDYKKINDSFMETIIGIIDKEFKDKILYKDLRINCTNCYNDHYIRFIIRSWVRKIFDINPEENDITRRPEGNGQFELTWSSQSLCHAELKNIDMLEELLKKLTTNFTELTEFKNYKRKILKNREDFQENYKIIKNILEKIKFQVKFKGKCEFLGGKKELKNIITKDGVNC